MTICPVAGRRTRRGQRAARLAPCCQPGTVLAPRSQRRCRASLDRVGGCADTLPDEAIAASFKLVIRLSAGDLSSAGGSSSAQPRALATGSPGLRRAETALRLRGVRTPVFVIARARVKSLSRHKRKRQIRVRTGLRVLAGDVRNAHAHTHLTCSLIICARARLLRQSVRRARRAAVRLCRRNTHRLFEMRATCPS